MILMRANPSLSSPNVCSYVTGNFLGLPAQGNRRRINQCHKLIAQKLRPTSCSGRAGTYLILPPGVGLEGGRDSGMGGGDVGERGVRGEGRGVGGGNVNCWVLLLFVCLFVFNK
jgi:hypothetical protein